MYNNYDTLKIVFCDKISYSRAQRIVTKLQQTEPPAFTQQCS